VIKIDFIEDDLTVIAATAAKISQTPFEKGSIRELYEECKGDKKEAERLINRILTKSRHLIFGDFVGWAITLENISRFAALYLWRNINAQNLIYGCGIEASFRVIKPNRYNEIVEELGKAAFKVYAKAIELGVPEQDARYLLPEGTLTRMILSAPPRYYNKLANSLKKAPLEELKKIGEAIETIVKEKFSLELPEEELPSSWEFWGTENININENFQVQGDSATTISVEMEIKGSLAMYAQLVRQRQILCEIEPIEGIARTQRYVVPPTFPQEIKKSYQEIAKMAKQRQLELIEKQNPNFVYFLLLGQVAKSRINGKGIGVIETANIRGCGAAQWEIRTKLGIPLVKKLANRSIELKEKVGPRCYQEGKCIEPLTFKVKKATCEVFAKTGGSKWEKGLEELLKILKKPYETFQVGV
jgi:thymidylate synthase ThyX